MNVKNLTLALALWAGLSSLAAPAAQASENFRVALALAEVVLVEFPDGGSTELDLQITADCGADDGLCMLGVATLDFALHGNSNVRVRTRPINSQRVWVNRRRMGQFVYETDPTADVPPLYYDVRFELVQQSLGEAAFSQPDVESPDLVMLDDLTAARHKWARRVNLANGSRLGRIYIQPVFDGGSTLEDLNLAVPGEYSAALTLVVSTL